ncbi:hypothetical protein LCGC14_0853320 [marine sediment metagenome]|uniref:Uncharacterized protein n=1 Tax=marine sediment metagenome TaxID=412755 RepID=A0A0F9P9M7_9ZZZZ
MSFPAVTNQAPFDEVMYNLITQIITDLSAVVPVVFDSSGDILLAAGSVIKFGGVTKVTYSAPDLIFDKLEVLDDFSHAAIAPSGDVTVANDATLQSTRTLTIGGNLVVAEAIEVDTVTGSTFTIAQIVEPDDPADEHSVMWCSNGTGTGDVGDIMLKIQHGGVVKSTTLVDFV